MIRLEQNPNLPRAVIVDIDGTLALMGDRKPFDWNRVDEDLPNVPIIELVQLLGQSGKTLLFVTGRSTEAREKTLEWLHLHLKLEREHIQLIMRRARDFRKDSVVKLELFNQYIRNKYYVEFALDDRNQSVAVWRTSIGIPCLQVADGDF